MHAHPNVHGISPTSFIFSVSIARMPCPARAMRLRHLRATLAAAPVLFALAFGPCHVEKTFWQSGSKTCIHVVLMSCSTSSISHNVRGLYNVNMTFLRTSHAVPVHAFDSNTLSYISTRTRANIMIFSFKSGGKRCSTGKLHCTLTDIEQQ